MLEIPLEIAFEACKNVKIFRLRRAIPKQASKSTIIIDLAAEGGRKILGYICKFFPPPCKEHFTTRGGKNLLIWVDSDFGASVRMTVGYEGRGSCFFLNGSRHSECSKQILLNQLVFLI